MYACLLDQPGEITLHRNLQAHAATIRGRAQELMLLESLLEQVKAGRGQVVSVVGAPGMGKSPLLNEFRQCLTDQPIRYAAGPCLAYGNVVPYLPILDLLRDHYGIVADDRQETRLARVHASLQQAGLDLNAILPYLLPLLGVAVEADRLAPLSAEARKARTFEAVRQLFLASRRHQPVVLAVEDLHWIDPTSEALLASLVDVLAGATILLLATFRPGYRPLWLDKSYATQLALHPLGPEESQQVVRRVLRDKALPPTLEQQLLARAEGNPFFREELAYTLREHGEGQPALVVPDTIQAVLAARMDRLPTPERQLLQAAAVVGKDISIPLLQAITALPEETSSRYLTHLQATEFVCTVGPPSTATYTFRHILIQDTAYQSLSTSTRQQYHHQIAQAVVEHFPSLAETQPELLAHHYTAAGSPAPAIAAWQRAGPQAAERSAHLEAITHFTQGLSLLQDLPDTPAHAQQELALQTALGPALIAARGYAAPAVEHAYVRARELCQQIGDTRQLFQTLRGLEVFHAVRAELQKAWDLAEHLLALAQHHSDPALLDAVHLALGTVHYHLGAFAQAHTHLEQGMVISDSQLEPSPAFLYARGPKVVCASWSALTLWMLGYPDRALQRSREAVAQAQALSHPFTLSLALNWAAWLHQLRREPQATATQAEAAMALSTEQGFSQWAALGRVLRGWALAEQAQAEAGIVDIRQGLTAYQATGAAVGRPHYLALLAGAYGRMGLVEAGLTALTEALMLVEKTRERVYEAELHRLRGELLLARLVEADPEAEICFQQALDMARRQHAKSLELRTAMSLSRLWLRQGKQVEARQLLAAVYNWFTEGFETADLQEARTLLAGLA